MSMLAPGNHGHLNPEPTSTTGQFEHCFQVTTFVWEG